MSPPLYNPASIGSLTLLDTQTAANTTTTTLTFSGIVGTYKSLVVAGVLRTDRAGTPDTINVACNADTTAANYSYRLASFSQATATTAGYQEAATSGRVCCYVPGSTSAASMPAAVRIEIPQYAGTSFHKSITGTGTAADNVSVHSCVWKNTAPITSLAFSPGLGTNFAQNSTVALYGVS